MELNVQRITRDAHITSDVLQETFIKIWLNREKLGDLRDARSYFIKIALHECFDQLNRLARQDKLKDLAFSPQQPLINSPEEDLSYKETAAIIQDAIKELPAQRKKIYELSRNKGLNSTEIAAALGLSPDYVRQAISAARKQIKDRLVRAGKLFLVFSGFF